MNESPPLIYACPFYQSQTLGSFVKAFAKAQAKFIDPLKSKFNTHFKNYYADLTDVLQAIRGPLNEQEIVLIQSPFTQGNIVTVTTKLIHASDEWIACAPSAAARNPGAQSIGEVITYLRRYGASGLTAVGGEVDDDGNRAMSLEPPAKPVIEVNADKLEQWKERMKNAKTPKELVAVGNEISEAGPAITKEDHRKLLDAFNKRKSEISALAKQATNGEVSA